MKKIQVLGTGCPKCKKLAENAESAAKELGIEYELEKVTQINDIMKMYPAGKLPPIEAMSMRDRREIEDILKGPLNGGKHLYTLGYPT